MNTGFCTEAQGIMQLIGNLLYFAKIILIIAVIIFGVIDFGKAVVGKSEDEIKKASKSIMFRLLAVIVIFFIPYLVGAIMTIVGDFQDMRSEYKICADCIAHSKNCK